MGLSELNNLKIGEDSEIIASDDKGKDAETEDKDNVVDADFKEVNNDKK